MMYYSGVTFCSTILKMQSYFTWNSNTSFSVFLERAHWVVVVYLRSTKYSVFIWLVTCI